VAIFSGLSGLGGNSYLFLVIRTRSSFADGKASLKRDVNNGKGKVISLRAQQRICDVILLASADYPKNCRILLFALVHIPLLFSGTQR
jgi:hypothetical protein